MLQFKLSRVFHMNRSYFTKGRPATFKYVSFNLDREMLKFSSLIRFKKLNVLSKACV